MRKLSLFISLILMGCLVSPPLLAKRKEGTKEASLNYRDLSPAKKLTYLSQLIFMGQWQEALERLVESGNLKLDAKQKNRLTFIQGYLFLMGGKAKEASGIFEGLEGKYPELDAVLPYWTARAERLSGDPKKALATLEKSCSGACTSPVRLVREYASTLCESGEKEKSLALFDQIAVQNPKEVSPEILRLDQMECKMKTGEATQAYSDLRTMYTQAPVGVPKERLFSLLKSLNQIQSQTPKEFSSEDRLSRVSTLKAQERWVEAAQELKDVLPQISDSSQRSLRQDAAETFFKARAYRDAAQQYEKLLKEQPERSDRTDLLEKLASSYARSNQFDQAIQTQTLLDGSSGEGPSAQRSYKIAFLKADAGRCEEAIQSFQDFLNRFPKSNKRDDALWQMAWCSYQIKKYDAALEELNQLEAEFPRGNYSQRAVYWRYRILDAAGKHSEAREVRQKFVSKYGESFYQDWEERMGRSNAARCPLAEAHLSPAKGEKFSLESLFASRGNSDSSTLRELLSLGLWEDFLEYYQKGSGGGLSLGESNDQLSQWVRFLAEAEQVPPELVWAVMREESHFKAKAFSNAGAMGLMQIIPQTGYEIAESLKLSQFESDDLFQPLINVRFGVHYLSQLLQKFSGNLVQAIAAYNAGPEAVERWQSQRPGRPCDEFIEEIPYRETHTYVQKVMKSFWNYKDSPPTADQIANQ